MRRKEKKELVWRRLDNSAKIFPLSSSRKYSSVFRISAVMKDKVMLDFHKENHADVTIATMSYLYWKAY